MNGILKIILVARNSGDELVTMADAQLEPGKGIVGDRYFFQKGTFSTALKEKGDFEVTLIESEEIDKFNENTGLNYAEHLFRRNLVTSGIRLNDLVGKDFSVGNVVLHGVRLCEPCAYLAGLLEDSVLKGMVHKAGLRAIIKNGGTVSTGDPIVRY